MCTEENTVQIKFDPTFNQLFILYSEIPTSKLNTTTEAIELTTITEEPGW